MITREKYGIRLDGNPVVETSTYIPVAPDHPLAVQLEGAEGYWARTTMGNSLMVLGAREVSKQEYLDAADEVRLRAEAMMEQIEWERDQRLREQEVKKQAALAELAELGISPESIEALLAQAKTGV